MDKIDNLDKKILSILSKNARIPFKDVAAECNVSRAAIHQRVQHLIEGDVIMGSGFDVNPKSLGYSTCTYVGINLERGSMYKDVVECLQHIPEIVECHFTTGPRLSRQNEAPKPVSHVLYACMQGKHVAHVEQTNKPLVYAFRVSKTADSLFFRLNHKAPQNQ